MAGHDFFLPGMVMVLVSGTVIGTKRLEKYWKRVAKLINHLIYIPETMEKFIAIDFLWDRAKIRV